MKNRKMEIIICILTFIFVTLGTTFAYFSTTIHGNPEDISFAADNFSVNLAVLPLYTVGEIIPMNNDDVMKAYNNECVDDVGAGACYAYTINVENTGAEATYSGTINFVLNDITNLNYLLLDNDDNTYVDITEIESGTDQTLGEEFMLANGESKSFTLLIWLPNFDYAQDNYDGGGSFNASLTYTSGHGGRITAAFSD